MMEIILLRKYEIQSQKQAKLIVEQARANLEASGSAAPISTNASKQVLWSKPLEEECARVILAQQTHEPEPSTNSIPDPQPTPYKRRSMYESGTAPMSHSSTQPRRASALVTPSTASIVTALAERASSPFRGKEPMNDRIMSSPQRIHGPLGTECHVAEEKRTQSQHGQATSKQSDDMKGQSNHSPSKRSSAKRGSNETSKRPSSPLRSKHVDDDLGVSTHVSRSGKSRLSKSAPSLERSSSPSRAQPLSLQTSTLVASGNATSHRRSSATHDHVPASEKSLRASRTVALEVTATNRSSSPSKLRPKESANPSQRLNRTVPMEGEPRSPSPTRAKSRVEPQLPGHSDKNLRSRRTVALEPRSHRYNDACDNSPGGHKERSLRSSRTVTKESSPRSSSVPRSSRFDESDNHAHSEKSERVHRTVALEARSSSPSNAIRTNEVEARPDKEMRIVPMEQSASSSSKMPCKERSLRSSRTVPLEAPTRSSSPLRATRLDGSSSDPSKDKSVRSRRTVEMEPRSSSPSRSKRSDGLGSDPFKETSVRRSRTVALEPPERPSSPSRTARPEKPMDSPSKERSLRSSRTVALDTALRSSSPSRASRSNVSDNNRQEKSLRSSRTVPLSPSKTERPDDLDSPTNRGSLRRKSTIQAAQGSSREAVETRSFSPSREQHTVIIDSAAGATSKAPSKRSAKLERDRNDGASAELTPSASRRSDTPLKHSSKHGDSVAALSTSLPMLDVSHLDDEKSHRKSRTITMEQRSSSPSRVRRSDGAESGISQSLHSYKSARRASKRGQHSSLKSHGLGGFLVDTTQASASIEEPHDVLATPTGRSKTKLRRFRQPLGSNGGEHETESTFSPEESLSKGEDEPTVSVPPTTHIRRNNATVVIRKVHRSPVRTRPSLLPSLEDSIVSLDFADFESFTQEQEEPTTATPTDKAWSDDALDKLYRDFGCSQTIRSSVSVRCRHHPSTNQTEYHLSPESSVGIGGNVSVQGKHEEMQRETKTLQKMLGALGKEDNCRIKSKLDDGLASVKSNGSKKTMIPVTKPSKTAAKGNGTPVKPIRMASPKGDGGMKKINWVSALETPAALPRQRHTSGQNENLSPIRLRAPPTVSLSGFGDTFFPTLNAATPTEITNSRAKDKPDICPMKTISATARNSSISTGTARTDLESFGSSSTEEESNKDCFGFIVDASLIQQTFDDSWNQSRTSREKRQVQRQKSNDGTMLRKMRSNSMESCSSAVSGENGTYSVKAHLPPQRGPVVKARRTTKVKQDKSTRQPGPSRARNEDGTLGRFQ
jgi:hypothetical protein